MVISNKWPLIEFLTLWEQCLAPKRLQRETHQPQTRVFYEGLFFGVSLSWIFTVKKSMPRSIKGIFSLIFHRSSTLVLKYWWLNFRPKVLMITENFHGEYRRCFSLVVIWIASSDCDDSFMSIIWREFFWVWNLGKGIFPLTILE